MQNPNKRKYGGTGWRHGAYVLTAAVLCLVVAPACGPAASSGEEDGRLRVTATTGMVADAARNVGGDHVAVTGLMGPGVDPHMYRPSQSTLRKLEEADLILYNGLMLEGGMGQVLDRMARRRPMAAVAEAVPRERLMQPAEYEGAYDPHVWFDVSLWMHAVEAVRDALIELDPDNEADYRANTEAYLAELEELDAYVREQIASIPDEQRVLVTAHDAFGYFGRAYDIEVLALQGISTAAEFGLQDITRLAREIARREIKAVFLETTIAPRSIQALLEGVRDLGHDVEIGGDLYSDAMGPEGSPEGAYTGMVRHNVDTIVRALR